MGGALEGLRVVDFGQYLAGPLTAMMLADLGAEVIRVDPPGGPRWRHPANALLQRGKRSIVLNLKQGEDQEIAERLMERADIVIEGFRPGVMNRLRLGAETALAANPRLIYCSIPGFSAEDPRASLAAWDGVVNAAAGLYLPWGANPGNYRGFAGADPVYHALPMSSIFGAAVAGHSILAALIVRERTGQGQRVEVPLFDAAFELIGHAGQRAPTPMPAPAPGAVWAQPPHMGHYQCADGRSLHLCLIQDRHLRWFARTFMSQEWIDDGMADPDRLRTDGALQQRARARFTELFKTRPALEWERVINEQSGAPCTTCATSAEWLRSDENGRAIGAVIELDDHEYGPTIQAGYPIRMSKTPPTVQGPRHPLDADREAILAELAERRPDVQTEGKRGLTQALAGMQVVDLTQVLAGPTSTRILAEYGAEVVKINSFEDRQLAMHLYTNSGKRSMLLNLKTPEGMELFWQLVARADVFVENFTRGVAERMGFGEEATRQHRPDIIYASVSAFGHEGFRGGYRGREELGQAPTGIQTRWGGDPEPMMYPQALCDYGAGNFAAFAVMAALYHRLRTGEGQRVHASLIHTATYHQIPYMIDVPGRVWDEPRGQEAKGWGPFDRLYRAADRWLYVAALGEGDRERLIGIDGLAEIDTLAGAELEEALEYRFAQAPAAVWVERLTAAGIGAHMLLDYDEVMEDSSVKARGLSIVRDHPGLGPLRLVGPSKRLWATPVKATPPVGPPGCDTRAVMSELRLPEPFAVLVEKRAVAEALPEGVAFVGQFR